MAKLGFRYLLTLMALSLVAAVFSAGCGGTNEADNSSGSAAPPALESGSIVVSGMVDYPMTFTSIDLDYMDWTTVTADDPATGSGSYDGVRLSDIWSFLGVQSAAKTVIVTGGDGSKAELTLAGIGKDALLSVADDDSFNLVVPGAEASAWVKDVVALEFK